MIKGFAVTEAVKDIVLAGVESAQTSKGLEPYWSTGALPITSGPHAGLWFIPFTDQMIGTNLREGKGPLDFPEAGQLLALLGGLEARVEINPEHIKGEDI